MAERKSARRPGKMRNDAGRTDKLAKQLGGRTGKGAHDSGAETDDPFWSRGFRFPKVNDSSSISKM